ncbi:type II CAAX endopeptidase family protein [Paenibacillus sp. LHD-117]|uniref:CPBP family intramembrane glutamic endopeptidase n=1 Tax=Paenibacillus sp. LHD-117 TaxID=3071412 RepID=UPI0027E09ABE|nr:type II CAAX endopeptidase family protein [Paenibacillus sp. LHD-117]MDQ6421675.1 type II CAAX endopeptidase family protein [Paenibacillus sp. LHD-117]
MLQVGFLGKITSLLLFGSLIVFLQLNDYLLIGLWGVCACLLYINKQLRPFLITTFCLGIGFFLYLQVNSRLITELNPKEWHIVLNRLSLIVILIPLLVLSLAYRLPFMNYWMRPHWNERIGIPFIWSGFRQTKVHYFLFISLTVVLFSFMPLVILKGLDHFQEVWLFAIVFSIANLLEEIIWRGALLSRFSEQWGDKWGVILTSVGFGLQHYSLGYSWWICAAFAVGGVYFGGITVQSKSIVPVLIWHWAINALMVFSGLVI